MKKCNNCNEKDCKVRNMAEETLDESRRIEGNKKGFRPSIGRKPYFRVTT